MRRRLRLPPLSFALVAVLGVIFGGLASGVFADNIDPLHDGSQWAWSENQGWITGEPSSKNGPGPVVSSTGVTGYLWSENAGWINLSCSNRGTCGSIPYGVTNNGSGVLAGYAWAENAGWISFNCSNTSTCGTVNYGVTINPSTGIFSGQAWAENIGWITFSDTTPVPYQMQTSWRSTASGLDTDGDGCPDVREQQTLAGTEGTGGRRDYLNQWDYFNPAANTTNRSKDIQAVVAKYGHDAGVAMDYNQRYDRTPLMGGFIWQFGPPNGTIRSFDISAAVYSYGHDCS
jgi:hypothetical protein